MLDILKEMEPIDLIQMEHRMDRDKFKKMMTPKVVQPQVKEYMLDLRLRLKELRQRLYNLMAYFRNNNDN